MFSSVAQAGISDGLVAYYPFNGNANDESGNGNHGIIYGDPEIIPGIEGTSFKFDGTNDYIVSPNFILSNRNQLSYTLWIKPDPSTTWPQDIISKHGGVSDVEMLFNIADDGKYEPVWTIGGQFVNLSSVYSGDPWDKIGLIEPSYNKFDFISVVYDGTKVSFFLNAQLIISKNISGEISPSNYFLTMGAYAAHPLQAKYKGAIDEVRIYNRALSESEIQELYYHGSNLNQGLAAYYPFNGNANDESGNDNHGTVYGATLTNDRFGGNNGAYYFDGNAYISIPNVLNSDISDITVSAVVSSDQTYYTQIAGSIVYTGIGETNLYSSLGGYGYGVKLSNGSWYYASYGLVTNQFINLTAVYKKGQEIELWINGELQDTEIIPSNLNLYNPARPASIGAAYGGLFEGYFFKGVVDEVRIYNRALTQSEIQELAQTAPPPSCTYSYSDWGACQPNNTQIRTVISSSPVGCVGTPVLSQSCNYVPPAGHLQVTPSFLAFGNIISGTCSDRREVTIKNVGNYDLKIFEISLSDFQNFSLYWDSQNGGSNPCLSTTPILQAGQSCTVTVDFCPSSVNSFGTNLNIMSNDPYASSVPIPISGVGTFVKIEVSPLSQDFGEIPVGSCSDPQYFTISNKGNADLNIYELSLTDYQNFQLNWDGTFIGLVPCGTGNPTIKPGEYCSFSVLFKPESIGAKKAQISISSNDLNATKFEIPISGFGVGFQSKVTEIALSMIGKPSGQSSIYGTWLTDVADGDGLRMRNAIDIYDMWKKNDPSYQKYKPKQIDQLMEGVFNKSNYLKSQISQLVSRIKETYDNGYKPIPTNDEETLQYMGIQKQCLEWVMSIVDSAGGTSKNYQIAVQEGSIPRNSVRPGMGYYVYTITKKGNIIGGHAMLITDTQYDLDGNLTFFKVAESNYGGGWPQNPPGEIPWLRVVDDRNDTWLPYGWTMPGYDKFVIVDFDN
jgi:hypothetical protein